MNYKKINRLASLLEAKVLKADQKKTKELVDKIDEQTQIDKEVGQATQEVPVPVDGDKGIDDDQAKEDVSEKKEAKIAHLKRLIKLAKAVKKSKKMSAEEKEEAIKEIKKSSKKAFGIEQDDMDDKFTINKTLINQQNKGSTKNILRTQIYPLIGNLGKIKANTKLSDLGVSIPMTVNNLQFRQFLIILRDILSNC